MEQRVAVFAEVVRNELSLGTREALALGRGLADKLGCELAAVILCGDEGLALDAIYCGADAAYVLAKPLAAAYQPEAYGELGSQVCQRLASRIVILPHSPFGCDLAPRLSFHLGVAWAAGCLDVELAGDQLSVTRHFVGGKVLLEEEVAFPVLVTIRSRILEPLSRDSSREVKIHHLDVAPSSASHLSHLEHISLAGGIGDELSDAKLVVSGGLGMGSEAGFAILEELAETLGASLGASKAAVDRGWVEPERQVGLTGVTVAPRVYVAVGISGSAQHMAGCSKSRSIIAVNKDSQANIFNFAKYGLVAEWEQALPILLAALKEDDSRTPGPIADASLK